MSTGGDFAAEVSWAQQEPILAKHFRGRRGLKIVEVGCGLGELAHRMQEAGHRVVAIDPSPDAIAATRSRGVTDARQCSLEELAQAKEERGTFDVVLFTRSLHHIGEDLEGVLRLVRDQLLRRADDRAGVPSGLLIIEEFGREDIDRPTAEWYYALHDSLLAAGLISPPQQKKEEQKMKKNKTEKKSIKEKEEEERDVLERWARQFKWSHHGMEGIERLHLGREMVAAIERVFGRVDVQRQPVLFRFIANHIDRRLNALNSNTNKNRNDNNEAGVPASVVDSEGRAYEIARAVWRWEEKMVDRHTILPLGIFGVAIATAKQQPEEAPLNRPSSPQAY
ncbi:methyltransferase domain containing protein [Acanthamoeba castellanii str. Neff]|uniref:Methyltransferase domain containing protein n=1 Tax=Acanthamoeba castellanii (strain ATCC 30010 / Neff) TaxID=1257118 RepID=L8GHT5_ACACF|nr:methyltransferase domain containing protein [Acanthamoeba castellanii str. Neff]ELR12323.1 methyltransferase domain containing protein [Acanthamoeba castellanii str. Neff]